MLIAYVVNLVAVNSYLGQICWASVSNWRDIREKETCICTKCILSLVYIGSTAEKGIENEEMKQENTICF